SLSFGICSELEIWDAVERVLTNDGIGEARPYHERSSHETCNSLPKPIAPSPELQTKAGHSNPTNWEAESRVPPREPVWLKAAINHRPVAQKQSTRPITGRS